MATFERKSDCPEVESLIWDKVAHDNSGFVGVRRLSADELNELMLACRHQLATMPVTVDRNIVSLSSIVKRLVDNGYAFQLPSHYTTNPLEMVSVFSDSPSSIRLHVFDHREYSSIEFVDLSRNSNGTYAITRISCPIIQACLGV